MESDNTGGAGATGPMANMGTPVAIVIAGALVAAALYFSNGTAGTGLPTNNGNQQPTATAPDSSKVSVKEDPFIGNANAPVTVAYWFDYQCPFCKQVEQQALPQVIKNYVDTGKVKIVFKDFQFLGSDSTVAAMVAYAVWAIAPEKYEAWHEAMFVKQDAENGGWGNKADILALTTSVGVDATKVDQYITANEAKIQTDLEDDKSEGVSFGINGTPGFIIGKQLVAGAQSYAVISQAIDTALAGK